MRPGARPPRVRLRFADADGDPLDDTGRPPGVPAEVAQTITFDALPGNRTLMRVQEAGYVSAQPLEMSRQGLEQSLDKLTPLFVGGNATL